MSLGVNSVPGLKWQVLIVCCFFVQIGAKKLAKNGATFCESGEHEQGLSKYPKFPLWQSSVGFMIPGIQFPDLMKDLMILHNGVF